jgi:hypothetical protein
MKQTLTCLIILVLATLLTYSLKAQTIVTADTIGTKQITWTFYNKMIKADNGTTHKNYFYTAKTVISDTADLTVVLYQSIDGQGLIMFCSKSKQTCNSIGVLKNNTLGLNRQLYKVISTTNYDLLVSPDIKTSLLQKHFKIKRSTPALYWNSSNYTTEDYIQADLTEIANRVVK